MDAKEYNKKYHPLINNSLVFLGTLEQNIQKSDTPEEVLKTFELVGWNPELKAFLEKAVYTYQEILIQQTQVKNSLAEEKDPQVYEVDEHRMQWEEQTYIKPVVVTAAKINNGKTILYRQCNGAEVKILGEYYTSQEEAEDRLKGGPQYYDKHS